MWNYGDVGIAMMIGALFLLVGALGALCYFLKKEQEDEALRRIGKLPLPAGTYQVMRVYAPVQRDFRLKQLHGAATWGMLELCNVENKKVYCVEFRLEDFAPEQPIDVDVIFETKPGQLPRFRFVSWN